MKIVVIKGKRINADDVSLYYLTNHEESLIVVFTSGKQIQFDYSSPQDAYKGMTALDSVLKYSDLK